MKINLKEMPFSRNQSYMVISEIKENYREMGNEAGLYLRTIHGSALTPLVAKISMTAEGEESKYSYQLEHASLAFNDSDEKIEVCYDDADTLLFRGSKGAGLSLDFLTDHGPYDYIYDITHERKTCYMANCYKNNCCYLVWAQEGRIELEQKWEESSSLYSRLHISGEEGFLIVLREVETEWDKICRVYDFDESRKKTEQEFLEFERKMPAVPSQYRENAYMASYLNWSSVVRKNGFLHRDAMYMSKNWMCNVWSWDHCFNAISLSYNNPETAWDQFMIMFDNQDKTGRLPDSINDAHVVWNYCKPPIHGWALSKMMENMKLSDTQLKEAYGCLKSWTNWWLTYRMDERGLCYYNHGNDSGWDNSTAFSLLPPVAAPDLQADLIIQMDVLAELAEQLDLLEEKEAWTKSSEELLSNFLKYNFRDNLPAAIQVRTGKIVENDSLLPYEILILGDRLPAEIREAMLKVIEGDKFYTEYGFATESPKSRLYRTDGYWRGPIWAPSTMLLLDGLNKCGFHVLAKEASKRFADMVSKSGFAENFDAMTGEGLRDRAYTWTSAVFLILCHEYLLEGSLPKEEGQT